MNNVCNVLNLAKVHNFWWYWSGMCAFVPESLLPDNMFNVHIICTLVGRNVSISLHKRKLWIMQDKSLCNSFNNHFYTKRCTRAHWFQSIQHWHTHNRQLCTHTLQFLVCTRLLGKNWLNHHRQRNNVFR